MPTASYKEIMYIEIGQTHVRNTSNSIALNHNNEQYASSKKQSASTDPYNIFCSAHS